MSKPTELELYVTGLKQEIAALKEERRWIPVEEQPVPLDGDYLVLGEWGHREIGHCDSDGKCYIYDYGGMERVTHWQLLPELPQEEAI